MAYPTDGTYTIVENRTRRIIVEAPRGFDESTRLLEEAIPAGAAFDFTDNSATWEEAVKKVEDHTPIGILLYRKVERHRAMKLAGHEARATGYLFGNFALAEKLYGADPSVFQYALFSCIIWEHTNGHVYFSVELPSSQFATFDDPLFTKWGRIFDAKIAKVLEHMGCVVPPELTD